MSSVASTRLAPRPWRRSVVGLIMPAFAVLCVGAPAGADEPMAVKLTGPVATLLRKGEPCFFAPAGPDLQSMGTVRLERMRVAETQAAAQADPEVVAKAPARRGTYKVRASGATPPETLPLDAEHCIPLSRMAPDVPDRILVGAFYSVQLRARFGDGEVGLFYGNFTINRGLFGTLKVEDLNRAAGKP
jgi:hypothetical protein